MPRIYHSKVVTACTDFEGRAFPMIYLANGEPGYVINQWIYWMMRCGMPESTLSARIDHMMGLYDFHYHTYGNEPLTQIQAQNLVSDFLRAKEFGHRGLGWKPVRRSKTLKGYWRTICLFDEWQATHHNAAQLTPFEEQLMSSWEAWCRWKRREQWSPMFHLTPSLGTSKKVRSDEPFRFEHQSLRKGSLKIKKAFPFGRFVELVETTPNPRDQMAWLMMGGCGFRMSELLHLFLEDIGPLDSYGVRKIRLDHPETGKIVFEKNGRQVEDSRRRYLEERYHNERFRETKPELYRLLPRTLEPKDRSHAGWKGMTFRAPETEVLDSGRIVHSNYAYWLDNAIAKRFSLAYERYLDMYFYGNPPGWPYHPWLFISIHGDDAGLPWTRTSMTKAWRRALKRLGLQDSGLGTHSLRHMFGACCAQAGVPLDKTMAYMHHAHISSTEVYYHLSHEAVHKGILNAVRGNPGQEQFYLQPGRQAQTRQLEIWR